MAAFILNCIAFVIIVGVAGVVVLRCVRRG